MDKINTFKTTVTNVQIDDKTGKADEKPLNPGNYTEEDYLKLGDMSAFKAWGKSVLLSAVKATGKDDMSNGAKTPYCSETYLNQILQHYIPTIPLWSCMLLGDLSRFNTNYKLTLHINSEDSQSTILNNVQRTITGR
jgi:hypothetical protein